MFIFLTLLELLSIGLIIPYINLIFNPEFLTKYSFINDLEIIDDRLDLKNLIIPFSFIFVTIFLLKTFFIIFVRAQIQKFSLGNQKKLQIDLIKYIKTWNMLNLEKKTIRIYQKYKGVKR